MNRFYEKTMVLVGALAMLGTGGVASAQTTTDQAYTQTPMVNQLKVNVPFNFDIGDNSIQAGTYELDPVTPTNVNRWQIKDNMGNVVDTFSVNTVTAKKTPKKDTLVFGEQGNREHLAEIWVAGDTTGWELASAPPASQMTNMRHVTAEKANGSWGSSQWGNKKKSSSSASNMAATTARPATGQIEAKVPFRFVIGDNHFTQGTYTVEPVNPADLATWQLKNDSGDVVYTFTTKAATPREVRAGDPGAMREPARSELLFDHYGEWNYLDGIWDANSGTAREIVGVPAAARPGEQNVMVRRIPALHTQDMAVPYSR